MELIFLGIAVVIVGDANKAAILVAMLIVNSYQ